MASFDETLRALGRGKVSLGAVLHNLDRTLGRAPRLAREVLARLDAAYGRGDITAAHLAHIRAHVRRAPPEYAPLARPTPGETTRDSRRRVDFNLHGERTRPPAVGGAPEVPACLTTAAPARESVLGPGTILKERFILDAVIGTGGMSTVFKGRDLRKVEVEDKNPWVALKVLNEDFQRYPDAYIALAREASRQQKLAHPNIATVYDFDRAGETVFMTMELLVGTPLDQYIRKVVKPRGGLPFAEAFPIVSGLAAALAYAHERQIVHSDFKPGNCFLTQQGGVKVFDFGIARAAKNPGQVDLAKTLYDPGKWGALTPAYASAEMLDGQDADTRDDLYALACVTFELLTGRHPFNKTPAHRARDAGLVPPPVKGLTRRQNAALARGLAFRREERWQGVAEFIDGLRPRPLPGLWLPDLTPMFVRWRRTTSALAGGLVVALLVLWTRPGLEPVNSFATLPPAEAVATTHPRAPASALARLEQELARGRLSAARSLLATLPATMRGEADLVAAATRLEERMATAERALLRAREAGARGEETLAAAFRAEADSLWQDRPADGGDSDGH
jgi:hypothetical protein